ncbi:UDP-N-acetylglucosamine--N-acetylmuramyl-(pentapeptide) pyrophosphoryl-undecaprenol N-acetylglucosamine transferase [Candidatus Microgenomates bacterium]|nr:UDP-N-acetylglucosamine--N-acetylmuramyl-(pentapeptide) pyrophosphoryl-undecaprenol N-acetylglucosamine transferase [Candidatus Microgenomates bacterium]
METKPGLKKIMITGGHFTAAKAVLNKLDGYEIYYVGRKHSMEGSKALALEFVDLANRKDIKFLSITAGRLQRKFFVNIGQSIKALLKFPIGFLQASWWILRYHPDAVLSFGGYVALPVVLNAWIFDIPVLTHEQTKSTGLANRIIKLFGTNVSKAGNPLREEILTAKIHLTQMVFITGGNQGSKIINETVVEILDVIAKKYRIVHQTGEWEAPQNVKNYFPSKFFNSNEMARQLSSAKMIVSRAGANTVEEVAYLGKPTIFIPIPWSSGNEQEKNAKALVDLGMAEMILQKDLTGKKLLETINKIDKNYDRYVESAYKAKLLVDPRAAEKIAEEVNKVIIENE